MKNAKFVGRVFPIMGAGFFLWCYIAQLVQMWWNRTAAGLSLFGWLGLLFALWCYHRFYSICCPTERVAIWCVRAEMIFNIAIVLTVILLR